MRLLNVIRQITGVVQLVLVRYIDRLFDTLSFALGLSLLHTGFHSLQVDSLDAGQEVLPRVLPVGIFGGSKQGGKHRDLTHGWVRIFTYHDSLFPWKTVLLNDMFHETAAKAEPPPGGSTALAAGPGPPGHRPNGPTATRPGA